MTHNTYTNGSLYNQLGGNSCDYEETRSGSKFIGILIAISILAVAGAGIWFIG